MARVHVICGGKNQIPLLKEVKRAGHEVLNTNLYEDSPGFNYADITGVYDVLDKEGNLAFARSQNADAVISDQSEISVRTVAFVSENLGVPSITSSVASVFTNKPAMRDYLQSRGFATPNYSKCTTLDEAVSFFSQHQGKAIIKPAFSHSSRGVYSINSAADISNHFEDARTYSLEDDQSVIIEEYLTGTEFTVDGLVVGGKLFNLAISEKRHYKSNENVANSLFFAYDNPEYDYHELRAQNKAIIEGTGIPFGLTHSEFKYCNGKFYMIEMAARGGGAAIAYGIAPYLSGINSYQAYISSALNQQVFGADDFESSIVQHRGRLAALRFLDFDRYGERVTGIRGIEKIRLNPNVMSISLSFGVGDILHEATDDSNRQGSYIAIAENQDELQAVEEFIARTLVIETETVR